MTYPTVIELRRPLEPTTHDTFADWLAAGTPAPGVSPVRRQRQLAAWLGCRGASAHAGRASPSRRGVAGQACLTMA
jgi:hypothetical protein